MLQGHLMWHQLPSLLIPDEHEGELFRSGARLNSVGPGPRRERHLAPISQLWHCQRGLVSLLQWQWLPSGRDGGLWPKRRQVGPTVMSEDVKTPQIRNNQQTEACILNLCRSLGTPIPLPHLYYIRCDIVWEQDVASILHAEQAELYKPPCN